MKNLILFLIIVTTQIIAVKCWACDFELNTHCSNKPYPYRTCDGHWNCFFDPRNPVPSTHKVISSPNKLCLKRGSDDTSPTSFSFLLLPGNSNVFTREQLNADFECAQNKWACVCNDQRQCGNNCEVEVVFVNDFRNYQLVGFDIRNSMAIGYMERYYPVQDGDDVKCFLFTCNQHTKILINNTTDFQRLDNDGMPTKYYFNRSNYEIFQESAEAWPNKQHTGFTRMLEGIDLCEVLTHELGHMYGLDHYQECSTSYQYDGIMNVSIKTQMLNNFFPLKELSNDDICAFKKLYCPQFTPVEEEMYRIEPERLYPNPATNTLNIQFMLLNGFMEVSFEIVDMSGNIVYRFKDNSLPAGNFVKPIDVSPFPIGTYLIKIYADNETVSKMFEIVK